MCGRFYVDDEMLNEIHKICNKIDANVKKGEVFPTDQGYVIKASTGGKEIFAESCKWGYETKQKGKVIFNARSETLCEKPLFRQDFKYHRCVIPVKGFYEWNKEKYYFESEQDSNILLLGGIYKKDVENDRFIIITTEANGSVKGIHDRMPLIIERKNIFNWIYDEKAANRALISNSAKLSVVNTNNYTQERLFLEL